MRLPSFVAAVLLSLALPAGLAAPIVVDDDRGRRVELPAPPQRVV